MDYVFHLNVFTLFFHEGLRVGVGGGERGETGVGWDGGTLSEGVPSAGADQRT